MVDEWQTRRREPGEIPVPPQNIFECIDLLQTLIPLVNTIKQVMEAKGLAPAFACEEWEIPQTVEQLRKQTHRLLVDFQNIRSILLHHGLANEMEFMPLQPRWRVDGRKHHQRNSIMLEGCVREIVEYVLDNKPFPMWAVETYDITPEQIAAWRGCFQNDEMNDAMDEFVRENLR